MCIRDSLLCDHGDPGRYDLIGRQQVDAHLLWHQRTELYPCLLYTSDAADERSSVDLGGRRIIKKKKNRR